VSVAVQGLEQIAEVIRSNYDLGEVSLPRVLENAHQRRHRKLVVETAAGKFLAKTYRNELAIVDALRFQQRLVTHLLDKGLPVPRIQLSRDGRGVVQVDTWALELQEFIEHNIMPMNTKTLTMSARALGRFHLACQGVPAPPRDVDVWRFSEVPRVAFQRLYQQAREEAEEQAVNRHCNVIALFLLEAAKALSAQQRGRFETGLIHGDWHSGNLLFQGDELIAIIDLEFAGAGCYLEDIAYAMSNLCVRTSVDPIKLHARTNMLLDNYQFSRTLSYGELVALYYAVGVKHVTTVAYQVPQHGGTVAGYTSAQWMERLALQCQWLEEQSRKARWGD
jgi:Ser/Thr protein kinase RdoA (MazF antagonist)